MKIEAYWPAQYWDGVKHTRAFLASGFEASWHEMCKLMEDCGASTIRCQATYKEVSETTPLSKFVCGGFGHKRRLYF